MLIFNAYLLANFGNDLWQFFAIFSLRMHRNGYLCTSYSNSDTAIEFSDPDFLRQGYFCDQWSFAIYIKFVTSSISRYSNTPVLNRILDRVLEQ